MAFKLLFLPTTIVASTQEAILRLRLNRANQAFWHDAARMFAPLTADNLLVDLPTEWHTWRDAQIDEIFSSLEWQDLRNLQINQQDIISYGVGKTWIKRLSDDQFHLWRVSVSGRVIDSTMWTIGESLPWALSRKELAALWDDLLREHIYHRRLHCMDNVKQDRGATALHYTR